MKKTIASADLPSYGFFFSILFILLFTGCRKNTNNQPEHPSSPPVLTVVENSNMANKTDSLIAVLDYSQYGIKYNFFGDYNNLGQPNKIKQVVITRGDTSLNYILDDSLRVRKFYCSLNSVKDTVLLEYDYLATNIILNRYYMDWANNLAVLRNQTVVNNVGDTSFTVLSSVGFRGDGILDFVTAETELIIANAAIVVSTTLAGLEFGVIGGVIGGVVGIILASKPVHAAEVKTSQTATSSSPPPTSQKYSYSIKVDSKSAWLNTGIQIKSGGSYTIQQTAGGWSVDINNYPLVSADGHTNEASTPLAGLSSLKTYTGAYFGALLGKVGNHIFTIGANFNGTIPYDGILYLQINDEARTDNSGNITIKITEN